MRLALAMWCLTKPPPRMIIPVLWAKMAWVLMRRRSGGHRVGSGHPKIPWGHPGESPQETLTLHDVQHQARAFVGVEENHVPQGAVGERRAQHRDLVLWGGWGNAVTPKVTPKVTPRGDTHGVPGTFWAQ